VVLLGRLERPLVLSGGKEVPPLPVGPLRYELRLEEAGVLLDGKRRLPLSLPLPGEWTPRDGKALLRAMAEGSGGRLLSPGELPERARAALPLRPYLLGLALLLFLFERLLEARRNRDTLGEGFLG
jgi:hypothetical protein